MLEEFLACVEKLEDVPDELKDWHPRANGQVLDLVHPSLYPCVYTRTVISSNGVPVPDSSARGVLRPQYAVDPASIVIEVTGFGAGDFHLTSNFHDSTSIDDAFFSDRFQWLPTDFAISDDGSSARAMGYINNLEPHIHANMYPVLERLVARFVPLWERVLGETAAGYHPPKRTIWRYERDYIRKLTKEEYMSGVEAEVPLVFKLPALRGPFQGHAYPPEVRLRGRTLQVIVKLANIHLVCTPEISLEHPPTQD